MIPDIIDFCIERIEENPDQKIMTMVFSILQRILKCWPKLKVITEKIINIYPDYPELLDKLFKYCLNEKDVEIKQKYVSLLT